MKISELISQKYVIVKFIYNINRIILDELCPDLHKYFIT